MLQVELCMETVNCKIKLANNNFILVNIFVYSSFIWMEKRIVTNVKIWIIKAYYSLQKSHLAIQIFTGSYVECLVKKLYLAEHFIQKVATLNTVTSFTVNSVMDVFLQVLQNFQNFKTKAVFKTIFKNTFCQWVNQSTCSVNIFQKMHVFKINIFYLSQFNFILRKELLKTSPKVLSRSFISVTYSGDIL